jgi:hypothetical protein
MGDKQNVQNVQLINAETDENGKPIATQQGVAKGGALGSPQAGKSSSSPSGQQVFASGAAPSPSQQVRSAQTAGPAKGSGFTGVGRFLQANVGSRLGEQVAGRVTQAGQQAQERLGEAVGRFQTGLGKEQQTFSAQQQAAQAALQQIRSGELTAVTPEQQAAYAAIASGRAQAPSGLENIEEIQARAQLASQLARGTQTAKGQMGLLRQTVGRGANQYTRGQSALDALILGQANEQLAAARRASAGLEKRTETQQRLAEEQARQFGAEVGLAKESITGETSASQKQTESEIAAQKAAYESGLSELSGKIKSEIASGELSKKTADILKNLGIDPSSQFYGLSLDEIASLVGTKDPATTASSANLAQLQKINALKQLSGQSPQFSRQQLETAGTTIDPTSGLKTTEDVAALQKTQREAYEKKLSDLLSGTSELSTWTSYDVGKQIRADPRLAMFQHSRGKGEDSIATDLANRFFGGELYNKETGQLNVDLANELKNFWGWRAKYEGDDGLFGPGIYSKYSGDAQRVAALRQLIEQSGPSFKVKPE